MSPIARAWTYAKREPWLVVGAVLVVVSCLLSASAAALAYAAQRATCERGNDFRRQDLPAAFAQFGEDLGTELGATRDQIDDFVAKNRRGLDHLFPERDC